MLFLLYVIFLILYAVDVACQVTRILLRWSNLVHATINTLTLTIDDCTEAVEISVVARVRMRDESFLWLFQRGIRKLGILFHTNLITRLVQECFWWDLSLSWPQGTGRSQHKCCNKWPLPYCFYDAAVCLSVIPGDHLALMKHRETSICRIALRSRWSRVYNVLECIVFNIFKISETDFTAVLSPLAMSSL